MAKKKENPKSKGRVDSIKGKPLPKKKKNPKKSKSVNVKRKKKKTLKIGFSTNNFNFIRSLLWQKHREDFKSYFDPSFIQIVRELFNDCKQAGLDCTEEVVLNKYEQIKKDNKRPYPLVISDYFEPKPYWEIKDVPFPTYSPYLYVLSDMILPYPHEFRITEYFKKVPNEKGVIGLDIFGYTKFFSNWVNWCNAAMRGEHGLDFGSDEVEIYFRFTEPIYNDIKQRWEMHIYTCLPSGAIYDYGYKPDVSSKGLDVEADFKLPKDKELLKEPIEEKEEEKKDRLKIKYKKIDAINAWDDVKREFERERLKKAKEDYDKQMEYYSKVQDDLDKEIRKYKRKGDKKKIKELEKMYSKVGDIKIKIIKDFGKILGF